MINIFTDGSCDYRSRLGGVGVYICAPDYYFVISKGYSDTTTSRMELRALLSAIMIFDKNDESICNIYSDSEYVVKTFTDNRFQKWDLINFSGIKNVDLWKKIRHEISIRKLRLKFHHIRGHQSGDDYFIMGNNIADKLANYKTKKEYIKDETEIVI